MTATKPKLRWFQFILRAMLVLTAFVAVLCSIGVCIHWLLSAVVGWTVMIGGISGRIVAGTGEGFVRGVVVGTLFLLGTFLVCLLPVFLSPFLLFPYLLLEEAPWLILVLPGIATLLGGILGGVSVRPRSER